MSYRGILTSSGLPRLTATWLALLEPDETGIIVAHDIDVERAAARSFATAVAAQGWDVVDIDVAGLDQAAHVAASLSLPAVHLGSGRARGIRPEQPPFVLPEGPAGWAPAAGRPGRMSRFDLTDDYLAHLRSLSPLHDVRPLRVALETSATAAPVAALAIAADPVTVVAQRSQADVTLRVSPTRCEVIDELGHPLTVGEVEELLALAEPAVATELWGVPSGPLAARGVLRVLGHGDQPLSALVADAVAHRERVSVIVPDLAAAARAVADALAGLGAERAPGEGFRLAGHAGSLGEWAVLLEGEGDRAELIVEARNARLRRALRDDARAILSQLALAA